MEFAGSGRTEIPFPPFGQTCTSGQIKNHILVTQSHSLLWRSSLLTCGAAGGGKPALEENRDTRAASGPPPDPLIHLTGSPEISDSPNKEDYR